MDNSWRRKLIFDIIGQNFFKVFTSKDKDVNYALLVKIYKLFNGDETVLVVDRETLVKTINEFWEIKKNANVIDEDDNDISEKSDNEKTNAKIRLFVRYKWLEQETENFTQKYSLNNGSSSILKTCIDLEKQEKAQLEYTGYVYTAYQSLRDLSKGVVALEQAYQATENLMRSLGVLHSTIKNYIDELLRNKNMTPSDIMDNVLNKYNDQVVMTMFRNINTIDNPERYSFDIISNLDEISHFLNMEKLIDDYINLKNKKQMENNDVRTDAEHEIRKMINYIKNQYKNISEILNDIDRRNKKYLISARKKMEFLTNNSTDVKGNIDLMLQGLKNTSDNEYFAFGLCEQQIVSDNSFYTPRRRTIAIKQCVSLNLEYNEENVEKMFDEMFQEDEFSVYKINEYAECLLGNNNKIGLSEIPVLAEEDFYKIFLLEMYGKDKEASYSIDYKDEYIAKNGYRIKNFEIARGKNYYGK